MRAANKLLGCIKGIFAMLIAISIGFKVQNQILREEIDKIYKETGKIPIEFWFTNPIYCLKKAFSGVIEG